jgi:predicted phosphoribosyltransferase|tara:strand:+ start:35 stop:211 length:177 start_codon:yes stop_codon:yes gene_type:complete
MNNADFRTIVELIGAGITEYRKLGLMTEDYEESVNKAVERSLKVLKDYLKKEEDNGKS